MEKSKRWWDGYSRKEFIDEYLEKTKNEREMKDQRFYVLGFSGPKPPTSSAIWSRGI